MRIIFTTKLDNMTYRRFLQQPKPAIVNSIIKKIIQNTNLIKEFDNIPTPVFIYILLRYWGFYHEGPFSENATFYPCGWLSLDTNHHPIDVTNHA